jgi:cytochrome oxidase Cu insertion factor (SCO1/SenC/PrrC family)
MRRCFALVMLTLFAMSAGGGPPKPVALHDAKDLEVGKKAPEIKGETVDGKPMKLSDYQGKVIVLDFFGDW